MADLAAFRPQLESLKADLLAEERSVVRWYECDRKRRYLTFDSAEAGREATDTHNDERGLRRRNLSSYECEWCRGYHIGSTPRFTPGKGPARPWDRRVARARRGWAKWKRGGTALSA